MKSISTCLMHSVVTLSSLVQVTLAALPTDAAWKKLSPHPRLFADHRKIAEVRAQDDEVSLQLFSLLHKETERALVADPIVFPSTGFLMEPAREAQRRILSLALSYRITGEKKYFMRAREELLHLSDLSEWRPSHFLGVGEAALAAGVGFDWLYDDLSPDDRNRVATAIVKNAILPSLEMEPGGNSWVDGDFNWTQVCHGGVVVAALAIAEREPELARKVVERAVNNFGKVGATYGPDGVYAEGPSYWSYGTSFHVILIEALRIALGTSCGLEAFPGFLKTADFNNQMVAPTGEEFNFSDYHIENLNEPIMLWFARETKDRSLARDELADLAAENVTPGKRQISRHLPLEILWWDPSLPANEDTRRLHWTAAGVLPIAVMRSAWDDSSASFIAVKGGTPNHSHAHMDVGSFILEADGVRWAIDLGTEDYEKMRTGKLDLWNYTQDSSRWSCFRVGPEGHNILRFDGAYQNVAGKAEIRVLPDVQGTIGNIVDLTTLYQGQVARVERTVKLHPDRTITIADEWTAAEQPVIASWQWLTKAKVTLHSAGLLLEQEGKSLMLHVTPPNAAIEVQDVSVPRAVQDSPNPGLSRIVIRIPTQANQSAKLRVEAVPGSSGTSRSH